MITEFQVQVEAGKVNLCSDEDYYLNKHTLDAIGAIAVTIVAREGFKQRLYTKDTLHRASRSQTVDALFWFGKVDKEAATVLLPMLRRGKHAISRILKPVKTRGERIRTVEELLTGGKCVVWRGKRNTLGFMQNLQTRYLYREIQAGRIYTYDRKERT